MSESFNTTKLDPARALGLAAACFDSVCVLGLGEAAKGHELAAKALASLPPEYAERIRRILAAQIDYREQARLLADAAAKLPPKPVSKPRAKPKAMLEHIARARKAGASSVSTPDGYTMRFGETEPGKSGNGAAGDTEHVEDIRGLI